jgi:hypothetical protein
MAGSPGPILQAFMAKTPPLDPFGVGSVKAREEDLMFDRLFGKKKRAGALQ